MAKPGRKKGSKIRKLPVGSAKVSSAFRIDKIEKLTIIDRVREVYGKDDKGNEIGWTSLIPKLFIDHLQITPDQIEARRQKYLKTGK